MSVYASRRYSCTARSGTRKERPTRTAESSPAWTRRYTVILETRIMPATSATVRKVTAARGAGTLGRPRGIAAGCWPGPGRATVAAIGRATRRRAGGVGVHRGAEGTRAGPTRTGHRGGGVALGHGHVFVSGPSSCRGAG